MNKQEAIQQLKAMTPILMRSSNCTLDMAKAQDMDISALEKQIPKKVMDCRYTNMWHGKCPGCKETLHMMVCEPYCMCCGQAILWEVEEQWRD